LLRVMQNTGHCILSPLKKREPPLPDIYANHDEQNRHLLNAFTIFQDIMSR
jgi:hypothetical protein